MTFAHLKKLSYSFPVALQESSVALENSCDEPSLRARRVADTAEDILIRTSPIRAVVHSPESRENPLKANGDGITFTSATLDTEAKGSPSVLQTCRRRIDPWRCDRIAFLLIPPHSPAYNQEKMNEWKVHKEVRGKLWVMSKDENVEEVGRAGKRSDFQAPSSSV